MKNLKNYIIGKPLKSSQIHHEKFSVLRGLPILSSDAISSVSYACEEILWVLVPVLGIFSFKYLMYVTFSILALLCILIFSYRQTIDSYPNGGGSYIVSKENLGELPSLIAGASLTIDYILTVAVSVTAGVAAITSTFPFLLNFKVEIALMIIAIMTIGNLRGINDSAKLFSLPTYLFIFMTILMIIVGLVKYYVFGIQPIINSAMPSTMGDLTILLFLKAFSSGCTALTGIEAISDGVANFKKPATKNAKKVLYLLFAVVFVIFGGVSWLATIYHSVPTVGKTSLSQIAQGVFGNNSILFFIMQFATILILTIAANTAFSDFPLLLSFIARDGYAPRQFSKRGDRLSFSNGIVFLAITAASLVLVFHADNHALLPLYAVGVFISFTLSQTGMVMKWCREKSKGWHYKAFMNGVGAFVTFVTSIVIFLNKFIHGAWVVAILIVALICAMKRVKNHYTNVAKELSLENEYFPDFDETIAKRFIVPVDGLNKSVIKTLNYSKCLSNNITALHISVDSEATKKLKEKWEKHKIDIPLVIKHCEYRNVIRTLIETIDSKEFKNSDKDIITVVLPEFTTKSMWQIILHNQTSLLIKRLLLKRAHIAVISTPFVISE